MNRIIIDLDGTLTRDMPGPYPDKRPRLDVIERLRDYKTAGYTITIFSARNMNSHSGNIGVINLLTLPGILIWLGKHAVPFDEVLIGKPWCGEDGFYVDDKAVRPSEFAKLSRADLKMVLHEEKFSYQSERDKESSP